MIWTIISDAVKIALVCFVPKDAEKPSDKRQKAEISSRIAILPCKNANSTCGWFHSTYKNAMISIERRYKMDQNKIGEFIAQCRKEHNMTQMQFAEKLGVTNKAVSKWETGKCLPDAALFDDICMLLNITLNELFAGERIAPENIEKKSEENLIGIATELQKKDHKIVLLKYFTAIHCTCSFGDKYKCRRHIF